VNVPAEIFPDPRTLLAAHGYWELGMHQDAWDELEILPPEERAAPEVLLLRLQILQGTKRWEPAAELAEPLAKKGCHGPDVYIIAVRGLLRGADY
jgi:uncharacterized protein HemY